MTLTAKQRDRAFGIFAENTATEYYISQGYAILERNWHFHKIEIDIIAQLGNQVVFVEVKARNGRGLHPLDAVDQAKRKRMARGADAYLRRMTGDLEYRFDIFALEGDETSYSTTLFEDAFVAPLM